MDETPGRADAARRFHSVNLVSEVITHSDLGDRADWIPLAEGVQFKPLFFDVTQGGWSNLLAVQPGCRLNRHYHTAPVHGYTVKGRWRYLEHDWVAETGTYIFEPPGEAHTLVVDDEPGAVEMVTFFVTRGSLIYTDPDGGQVGYEDVFTRLTQARARYREIGRDPGELEPLIR